VMLELEESADEVFDEQVERFFKVLLSTPLSLANFLSKLSTLELR